MGNRTITDRSRVLFDDNGVGDGKALAGSLADILGGEKWVENQVADFFGHADTLVLDADFRPGAVAPRADGDVAFAVGAVVGG